MHVFISYAKRDTRDLAQRIRRELEAIPDVTAWMDESLQTGQSWAKQIQREIVNCDCFIVLLSPDVNREETAEQSYSFVLNEIELAQDLKKPIIPVMAQKTTRPVQIIALQYLDFTQNEQLGMQRLLVDVKNYLLKTLPNETGKASNQLSAKPQPVAVPISTLNLEANSSSDIQPPLLVSWSPGSWLLLLWWILIKPSQYQAYLNHYGKNRLRSTVFALAFTLVCFPLWLINACLVFRSISKFEGTYFPVFTSSTSLMIVSLIWLFSILLFAIMDILPDRTVDIVSILMFGILLVMAILVVVAGAVGLVSVVLCIIAGVLAINVIITSRIINIGICVTVALSLGLSLVVTLGVNLGMVIFFFIILEGIIAGSIASVIISGIKNRKPGVLNYIILMIFPGVYATLIYIFLLGGYRYLP